MNKHFLKRYFSRPRVVVSVAAILLLCLVFNFILFLNLVNYNKKVWLFNSLRKEITTQLKDNSINYSILIRDLGIFGPKFSYNENSSIVAASLIKLPVLAVVFVAENEGLLSLDQEVIIQRKDITGGSGILKAKKLPLALRLSELLKIMVSRSDNTATNKIIELLGFDYLNLKFKELGLHDTSLSRKMMDFKSRKKGIENYTSARDIAYLLEKIYKKDFLNKKFSELALSWLKQQKVKDRLPRYLPEGTVVAHKTGLERGIVHDAGIVFSAGGNYIICVMLSNASSYKKAKKFIAQLSLLTYNLYNTK